MEKRSIIIVDDEGLTRSALIKGVHWNILGINHIWEAGSAAQAKSILLEQTIDFALIDIEMPGESGLQLLEWIRENLGDKIQCAVLTCHASFPYAQHALRLKSVDYILKPVDFREIEKLLLNMVARIDSREKDEIFLQYGKQWLREKSEESVQYEKNGSSVEEMVSGTTDYIRSHLTEKISLSDLAEKAGYNLNYFNKVFKDKTGMTVNRFIINERMKLAAKLIEEDNGKIYAIAEYLGYENYASFANMFKKVYGVAPNVYADEHKSV